MQALNLRAPPRFNHSKQAWAQFAKKQRLRERQKTKLKAKLGFKPRVFVALHIDTQAQVPFPSPAKGQEKVYHPTSKLRPRRTAILSFHWLQLHSQWLPSSTYIVRLGTQFPEPGD